MMKTLIIDDSKTILAMLSEWFKDRNYEVLTATSGEKGLELFAQHEFDIVVLDVEMPGLTGFQVAHTIRGVEQNWTPIIFMSGSGNESYYQKGINAGGDFFFTKPLNMVMVDAFIYGVERMYRMRTQLQDSNTELTALRDNTNDGIISFDKEGVVTKINKSGRSILSSTDFHGEVTITSLFTPIYNDKCALNSKDMHNGNIRVRAY